MTQNPSQNPPQNPSPIHPMFSFDVSADVSKSRSEPPENLLSDIRDLLLQLVQGQQHQSQLLEESIQQAGAAQKHRAAEIGQWRKANPHLATACREAVEAMGKVQSEFLQSMTAEINANSESMMDSEFMMNEFIDRFGPRLAHMNGVLQVLSQLGATPSSENAKR